jgi:ribonuclease BN (tRNA processing enzyme)
MNDFQFLARIYGVRGSYPVAPEDGTVYGGNTTCLLVRTPEHIVIFDAGSGIIKLGRELVPEILEYKKKSDKPFNITILFTHTHIDHLLGFPYFAPLYIPGVRLNLVGPATMGVDFEDILRTLVEPQYYPVGMDEFRSDKEFTNISENMIVYFLEGESYPYITTAGDAKLENADLVISNMKYYFHPKDGSYNYRVNWNKHALVLATDVEQYVGSDQRLIKFAESCDVLIHDAQYNLEQYLRFQGYGHSNFEMACQVALKAKVKKLLLFHHDPNNDDDMLKTMEGDARKIFSGAEMATESWEWKL